MVECKEISGIETVGELRKALSGLPDDMPVSDGLGDPLLVRRYMDSDKGGEAAVEVY